ncbi:MAG TPA: DUF4845 domain-containing protein [Candidatus Competibacteraceae bacterium]|nr:DUF4845 domain-containing protein [Candidatus Competibacteraceae bacterium]
MKKGNGRLSLRRGQRGISTIGALLVFIVLGALALLAMKIVPIYIDYFTVRGTIKNVGSDPELSSMSKIDLANAIQRRFDIGYVDKLKAKDLKIREENRALVVELDYEDRRTIVSNVDIVVHFQDTFRFNR